MHGAGLVPMHALIGVNLARHKKWVGGSGWGARGVGSTYIQSL